MGKQSNQLRRQKNFPCFAAYIFYKPCFAVASNLWFLLYSSHLFMAHTACYKNFFWNPVYVAGCKLFWRNQTNAVVPANAAVSYYLHSCIRLVGEIRHIWMERKKSEVIFYEPGFCSLWHRLLPRSVHSSSFIASMKNVVGYTNEAHKGGRNPLSFGTSFRRQAIWSGWGGKGEKSK